ncbi:hypothetical protein J8J14_13255 [Roseomonas sp. SSH11]|uniref:2-keto-4-pentenoate hydratase n=1 Tax=Pararoseomonas baculiformis TaxID=2820812 RepID=A0ABS4AFC9_9PROT|nr:hypothetical protein [Pararoseomonas baculiformis]MBP0445742.1 hypothetical protein [Pararoseomonas baculiformis]
MDKISAAAERLARARGGPPLAELDPALRPASLAEAEAIQNATFHALGESPGGWKLGRQGEHLFSAPIPDSRILVEPGEQPIPMPPVRFIELELALSFPGAMAPAGAAALTVESLPRLARLAVLLELVQPRFEPDLETGPLDRIAECLGNHGAVIRTSRAPWSLDMLDAPPPVRLSQDGVVIATREGPHVAAPLRPLLEEWLGRIRREGRGIGAGEVVTLGSLTGMPAIPAGGARYLGEIEGLEPLACVVAPA